MALGMFCVMEWDCEHINATLLTRDRYVITGPSLSELWPTNTRCTNTQNGYILQPVSHLVYVFVSWEVSLDANSEPSLDRCKLNVWEQSQEHQSAASISVPVESFVTHHDFSREPGIQGDFSATPSHLIHVGLMLLIPNPSATYQEKVDGVTLVWSAL